MNHAEQAPFEIGAHRIAAGERRTVNLPVSVLSDHTQVTLSAQVLHARAPGPTVFVSAAIHGDEVIGVEIVRRLLRTLDVARMRGTVIAVPIVNSFGFMNGSRYLPDRRDLNRSFPGSASGSLAARLADLFLREVVRRSDLGIDLHSAAIHRANLPQIRVSPNSPRALELADAFGAPVIITSKVRDGSLRQVARDAGVDILLFEGGGGLRFDEGAARAGASGVLRVLQALGMLDGIEVEPPTVHPIRTHASRWVRAPAGGLLRTYKSIGDALSVGDLLGVVSDPFGEVEVEIFADAPGLVIGRTNLPVVNEGDALFHVASIASKADAQTTVEALSAQLLEDPLFDEDEII